MTIYPEGNSEQNLCRVSASRTGCGQREDEREIGVGGGKNLNELTHHRGTSTTSIDSGVGLTSEENWTATPRKEEGKATSVLRGVDDISHVTTTVGSSIVGQPKPKRGEQGSAQSGLANPFSFSLPRLVSSPLPLSPPPFPFHPLV